MPGTPTKCLLCQPAGWPQAVRAEQYAVWTRAQDSVLNASNEDGPGPGRQTSRQQTQFVRINNNSFTAEDTNFRGGFGGGQGFQGGQGGQGGPGGQGFRGPGNTEVIQRGGPEHFTATPNCCSRMSL
jgi:hypothetical protein